MNDAPEMAPYARHVFICTGVYCDPLGKAERLLGWRPQVMLAEGMARLAAWYRANREWASRVATE